MQSSWEEALKTERSELDRYRRMRLSGISVKVSARQRVSWGWGGRWGGEWGDEGCWCLVGPQAHMMALLTKAWHDMAQ